MEGSIIPVIKQLEELFTILNDHFYESELPTPVIVASTTGRKKAYGWCTTYRAWTDKSMDDIHSPSDQLTDEEKQILAQEDGYFEINICAEYLSRSFEDICETMLHEMVHLYCAIHGIKDCTKGGAYHNTNYKDAAEKHGLEVARNKYGWSETSLKYSSLEFIRTLDRDRFALHRRDKKEDADIKKKQSLRKYMCINCGTIIRASRDVKVICSDCNKLFLEVKKDDVTGIETTVEPEQEQDDSIITDEELAHDDQILAAIEDEIDNMTYIPDTPTISPAEESDRPVDSDASLAS